MNLICHQKHFFEYTRKQAYFQRIHELSNLKKVNFSELQCLQPFEYMISVSIKWLLGNTDSNNFFLKYFFIENKLTTLIHSTKYKRKETS